MCVGVKAEDSPLKTLEPSKKYKLPTKVHSLNDKTCQGRVTGGRRRPRMRLERGEIRRETTWRSCPSCFPSPPSKPSWTRPPSSDSVSPASRSRRWSAVVSSRSPVSPSMIFPPGLNIPSLKDENPVDFEVFSTLPGFTVVLGSNSDIIFVSENVTQYIGLTQERRVQWRTISHDSLQVELLGQEFPDYVHPCDHRQLNRLRSKKESGAQDEHVEVGSGVRRQSSLSSRYSSGSSAPSRRGAG